MTVLPMGSPAEAAAMSRLAQQTLDTKDLLDTLQDRNARLSPAVALTAQPKVALFTGSAVSNWPAPMATRLANWDAWLYGTSGRKTELLLDFAGDNSFTSPAPLGDANGSLAF